VLGHSVWRRHRHLAYARRTGRNTDPGYLRDTRVEQVVSYLSLGLAAVLAGFSALGAWQTHQNVRSNLAEKYQVTAVDNASWSGAFLVADLTMADGTVRQGATVYFEADGEPLTGEDVFSGAPGS
jgi:putative copper export protein